MKIIDVEKTFSYELAAKEAAITLLKDGVVVYPTDTLYGLGANALDEKAIEKVFLIKKRPKNVPMPVMVSSIEMAKALAFIDKSRERILSELWPGPYTFVLWKRKAISKMLTAGKETVALRIPSHPLCQGMIRDFEGPITVTSANISGEEHLSSAKAIAERFSQEKQKPNLIIDAGDLPTSNPSAIVDLTSDTPKLLRVNPTTKDNLLKLLDMMSK